MADELDRKANMKDTLEYQIIIRNIFDRITARRIDAFGGSMGPNPPGSLKKLDVEVKRENRETRKENEALESIFTEVYRVGLDHIPTDDQARELLKRCQSLLKVKPDVGWTLELELVKWDAVEGSKKGARVPLWLLDKNRCLVM